MISSLLLFSACSNDNGTQPTSTLPEDSETPPLSVETIDEELLCQKALSLLEQDALLASFFAGGGLSEFATAEGNACDYRKISGKYALFSEIEDLIDSTYTALGGMKDFFLSYPSESYPSVRKSADGGVEINTAYISRFDIEPTRATLKLLSHGGGDYLFQYCDGTDIFQFTLKDTEAGLRLEQSLFYLYENQLVSSQPEIILKTQSAGNAKVLRGNCTVVHFFTDTPGYTWTPDARAQVKARFDSAKAYIIGQASIYGVYDIRFTDVYYDTASPASISDGTYASSWVRDTLAAAGYIGIDDVADSDNFTVLFHINGAGRSFSMVDEGTGTEEYAVVFHSTEGAYKSCVATYIHEIMHNFGAVDLYGEVLSAKGADLAALYFPSDIMRIVPENINQATVGLLTAKLIGWCDKVPPHITEFLNNR